jgi:hypothetical protein
VVGACDRHRLEVLEQRRALVPGRVLRAQDDVVALLRRQRDRHDVLVGVAEGLGEPEELLRDAPVGVLVVVDQVHLVDREHQARHAQQAHHRDVPAGLLDDPGAGVHQQHGQRRGGRAGDRVAGVLDVPGGVGEDERAPRRGEVPVGDVDRDALLALRAQPVDEQRQVGVAAALRGALDGLHLVGEHRLGVVEQTSDQRRLAVVDAARSGELEQVRHQK